MGKKIPFIIIAGLLINALIFGGAIGYGLGRGNSKRLDSLESANRELTSTVGSLEAELTTEREIAERIRGEQAEERSLITAAIDTCGRAGGGVQGIIAKMEILNDLIRELERRAGGYSDIPSGE